MGQVLVTTVARRQQIVTDFYALYDGFLNCPVTSLRSRDTFPARACVCACERVCVIVALTQHSCVIVALTCHNCPIVALTCHNCPIVALTQHSCMIVALTCHNCPIVALTQHNRLIAASIHHNKNNNTKMAYTAAHLTVE